MQIKADQRNAVLLIANYSNRTGYAWRNIYRLFRYLARSFNDAGLNVYVSFGTIESPVDCLDDGVVEDTFEFNSIHPGLADVLKLCRTIHDLNIRYLYTTDLSTWKWWYVLVRLCGVQRIIVHSRISVSNPYSPKPPGLIRSIIKLIISRLPLINVDEIIAVSDFVKRRYLVKHRFPERKIRVILNGIDTEKITPSALESESTGGLTIFCSSRAQKYKGIHIVIQALAELRDEHGISDVRLNYAGDGPDLRYFTRLCQELSLVDHVEFLGEICGTYEYLKSADAVVVPSMYGDACPSTISEALAAGKPLIATRAGGIPEMVGDDANALLVEPGSVEELTSALKMLYESVELRSELSNNGRQRAVAVLSQHRYHSEVAANLFSILKVTT